MFTYCTMYMYTVVDMPYSLLHCYSIINHYALSSGHPGGLTPGTYGGIVRDLLTFVANFWPRTGTLDHFCTPEARYTWKDPQDL